MTVQKDMGSHTWDDYAVPDHLPPVPLLDPELPLVSIVTPSLNQGQFIGETIDSVLGQDYPNIEYWIIDGGSHDSTLEVLRRYRDPRLHWISEPDKGHTDAINKGLSRCRGDILAYLNSDDTFVAHAIRHQVMHLLQTPHADVVYGDAVFTYADGRVREPLYGRPFSKLELLRFTIPTQPTVFWTRRAMQKAGPFDPTYKFSMDSEYWLRLESLGFGFTYNPQLIATYRLHEQSKTSSMHTRAYEDWERLINYYAPDKLKTRVLADLFYAVAIDMLDHGHPLDARNYARKALHLRITRRALLYALAWIDDKFNTSIYKMLIQRRNNKRRKL